MTIPAVVSGNLATGRIPSKTYRIDFKNKRITSDIIDKQDAVHQAALKSLLTNRYENIIYTQFYGFQGEELIGKNPSLVKTELKRMIEEALIYDDRINSVVDFKIELNIDFAVASFTLETIFGDIPTSIDLTF